MTWYCKNRHFISAHHNTHMADKIDLSTLYSMPLKQKQEWVHHVEVAKEDYKKDWWLPETKQKPILEYMVNSLMVMVAYMQPLIF